MSDLTSKNNLQLNALIEDSLAAQLGKSVREEISKSEPLLYKLNPYEIDRLTNISIIENLRPGHFDIHPFLCLSQDARELVEYHTNSFLKDNYAKLYLPSIDETIYIF